MERIPAPSSAVIAGVPKCIDPSEPRRVESCSRPKAEWSVGSNVRCCRGCCVFAFAHEEKRRINAAQSRNYNYRCFATIRACEPRSRSESTLGYVERAFRSPPGSRRAWIGSRRSETQSMSVRIDYFAVKRREMAAFFFDDLERAGVSQMAVAATGNRRGKHRASVANQISYLLLEIDLNRRGSARLSRSAGNSKGDGCDK